MMMNWLVNYHFDGLRIDAAQALKSDCSLKYFTSEIRNHPETRGTILLPEYCHKQKRLTAPIAQEVINDPIAQFHNQNNVNKLGFDVGYTFDLENTLTALSTNMEIYGFKPSVNDLAKEFTQGILYTEEKAQANNDLVMFNSHDKSNLFGGVKPLTRVFARETGLAKENKLVNTNDLDKTPYLKANEILLSYLNNPADKNLQEKVTKAKAVNRLMIGAVFIHPAQKLFSLSDEKGNLTPFQFFAEYTDDELYNKVSDEKGYRIEEAFDKSLAACTDETFAKETLSLSKDLADLMRANNSMLTGDYSKISAYPLDDKTMCVHRWSDSDEIYAVFNFSDNKKEINEINCFPNGQWEEVINTDSVKYGGSSTGLNSDYTQSRGNIYIQVAPKSMVIFKKKS
jgi:1,4-alpha-glucan branching enzyme